ncbi:MAG: alpha/beta hydrolase family protein [Fimbriimonadaceae bacterium]|nr:alpha/beta hydrolase family protein [Fimbriimonadaceae bacterium]
MLQRRSGLVIALAIAVTANLQAQSTSPVDLRQPVPPLIFEPWKLVSETDSSREYSVSFPSPDTSPVPENNVVPVRAFVPTLGSAPHPVVLILHFWGARDLKVERSLAGQLARRGIASVIMALPYHLGRTPPGKRSGELAIQPDPAALRATMTQAVRDVKRTVDFIASRSEFDGSRIGISGTSLGALVASLAYGTESRFSRAAFVLGGMDLAQILWSSSLLVEARDALRRRGFTENRLRFELAEVEPLTYIGTRKSDQPFIIGGRFDTVIPTSATDALIGSFEHPKVLWLETGHYGGIFVQSRILKEVANYFQAEFGGNAYVAPKRIFVPTLRIGVEGSTSNGMDIGVGIDLWKSNRSGDWMGTGLITPRGPQLFLGYRVSAGLSIGASIGTKRVGAAIFWSRVL